MKLDTLLLFGLGLVTMVVYSWPVGLVVVGVAFGFYRRERPKDEDL